MRTKVRTFPAGIPNWPKDRDAWIHLCQRLATERHIKPCTECPLRFECFTT